jgi:hypothetical protein
MKKLAALSCIRHLSLPMFVPIRLVLKQEQREALEGRHRRLVAQRSSRAPEVGSLSPFKPRSPVQPPATPFLLPSVALASNRLGTPCFGR